MSRDLLYLSRADVERVGVPIAAILDVVERAFVEKATGRVQSPPKVEVNTGGDATLRAMLAHLPGVPATGMKWISAFPGNVARDLPAIHGLIVLNDTETGAPGAILDCTWITAMRTAAATALAARHLARGDSARVGIVACGAQGRSNLEALAAHFTVKHVKAFDLVPQHAELYAAELGEKLGLSIETVATPEEAVRDRDIVVTSGPISKHPSPVVEAEWLAPGAFGCALEFDSYWKAEAFRAADKLACDEVAQLEHLRSDGYFKDTPQPSADLAEILTGGKPGRETPEERIISIHLGLGLQDVATAALVRDLALKKGIGTRIPL